MASGDVRIRSNVILEPENKNEERLAREAIPGDLLAAMDRNAFADVSTRNGRQWREKAYNNDVCAYCRRKDAVLSREGCSRPNCVDREHVVRIQARRSSALEEIDALKGRIAAGEEGTIRLRSPERPAQIDLLGVDEAVERLVAAPSSADEPALVAPDTSVLSEALDILRAPLERAGVFMDARGYVPNPLDNLLGHMTVAQARRALAMVRGAAGGELTDSAGTPAKFKAAHSSAALVVNSFAPWLDQPGALTVGPHGGFDAVTLEAPFPTGLPGTPPTLDLFLPSSMVPVAIESKCTEYLDTKPASFQPSYRDVVKEFADGSWAAVFSELGADPVLFKLLDAGQLVRHYVGLKRRTARDGGAIALGYLYWEPADASARSSFAAHRDEIARFSAMVSDPTIPFFALSYTELWEQWAAADEPSWAEAHCAALRERYATD